MPSDSNASSAVNCDEFIKQLELERKNESRNVEYKSGNIWNNSKFQITRALMGLSNLQYGGRVVVGVDQKSDDPLVGVTLEQRNTYDLDKIEEFVNEYADPPLEIRLSVCDDKNEKFFIIIDVSEFSELPTICKKDAPKGNLKRGKIYIRPKRHTETSDNFSHHDMRELLDLATMKHHKKQVETCQKYEKINKGGME